MKRRRVDDLKNRSRMNGEILLYKNQDGDIKIDVRLESETVWLAQAQMATLFGKDKRTISEHIGNIFKEGELDQNSVVRKFRTTAADGKNYAINHYNLDVIISVGYRVKSVQGTQFRIWATQRLKEYINKKQVASIKKAEVSIAKNYLNEEEMRLLGLLVEQYLAFTETMAQQQTPMYMKDWIERLDTILQLNGRELLTHAGKVSRKMALEKSGAEYEKFKQQQKAIEKEASLKELEEDIKKLKKPKK